MRSHAAVPHDPYALIDNQVQLSKQDSGVVILCIDPGVICSHCGAAVKGCNGVPGREDIHLHFTVRFSGASSNVRSSGSSSNKLEHHVAVSRGMIESLGGSLWTHASSKECISEVVMCLCLELDSPSAPLYISLQDCAYSTLLAGTMCRHERNTHPKCAPLQCCVPPPPRLFTTH